MPQQRSSAIDVFRGLLLLLLLPDPNGGLSIPHIAHASSSSALLDVVASQMQHSRWSGLTLWDLIMPAFLFIVGAAMPFSQAARRRAGATDAQIASHALLRCFGLVLLGLTLSVRADTLLTEFWPLLLLGAFAFHTDLLMRTQGDDPSDVRLRFVAHALLGAALLATAVRLAPLAPNVGIVELNHLLVQLGLASIPAIFLVRASASRALQTAFVILAGWWLAFALYEPGQPLAAIGTGNGAVAGELSGHFAHWNPNVNFASAADTWLLTLWPRGEPFTLHAAGLQFTNVVPTAATVLFGLFAGRLLTDSASRNEVHRTLATWGAALVAGGIALALSLVPVVKSLWSPSYALISAGICFLALALLQVRTRRRVSRFAASIALLGTNALLLYVLTMNYRWRILRPLDGLTAARESAGPWWSLIEALFVLAVLWLLALGLKRARVHVRF